MSRHNATIFTFIAICSLAFSSSALAASAKRIERSIDAGDLTHVDFEVSVAEMDIEIYNGDQIELDISLEADRGWWFFGRKDIDDVDVFVDIRGDSVEIILDEDNVEQDWRVRIPAHLAVSMEIGVGDVDIEGLDNDLLMEMGVGAIQVTVADIDFDTIHVQTGVGDSSLRGFGRGIDNERNFVGADSYYRGEGEHQISIELGVGDAEVRRR